MTPLANGGGNWVDFDVLESPLEDMFAWQMRRTKLGLSGVFVQVPISNYRVDFLVQHKGMSIVVELDGRTYHNKNKDAVRDQCIIKHVDAIIRIPYSAMLNENAVMVGISQWFDRFAVKAETSTVPFAEAMREFRQSGDNDFSQWDWMQVYTQHAESIRVGSLKQIAMGHNILPITLRTRTRKTCRE